MRREISNNQSERQSGCMSRMLTAEEIKEKLRKTTQNYYYDLHSGNLTQTKRLRATERIKTLKEVLGLSESDILDDLMKG